MPENGTHHVGKGERIARLEAKQESTEKLEKQLQEQLDRRLGEHEKLFNEKMQGDRREADAIHRGLETSINRVENTSDKKLDLIGERSDKAFEAVYQRVGALERGDSQTQGERRLRASMWTGVGVLAAIGYLIVVLVTSHVI